MNAAINKERTKIKIYNSIPINKPVQPIKPSNRTKEILNFNDYMYKCEKDVLNIENAKKYNLEINKKNHSSSPSKSEPINNSKKEKITNCSNDDLSHLSNKAKLKDTCSSFTAHNPPSHNYCTNTS